MEDPIRELSSIIRNLTMGNPQVQAQTINTYFTPSCSFSHPFILLPSFLNPIPSRLALLEIYRFYKFLSPRILLRITSLAIDKGPLTPRTELGSKIRNDEEEENIQVAYARCEQDFRFFFWPFWTIKVELVAQLTLIELEEDDFGPPWSIEIGTSRQKDGIQAIKVEPESHVPGIDDGTESMTGSEATVTAVSLKNESQQPVAVVETKTRKKLWYIKEQKDLYQDDQFLAYLPFSYPGGPTFLRMFQRIAAFFTVVLGAIVYAGSNLINTFFGALEGARSGRERHPYLHRRSAHVRDSLISKNQKPHHCPDKTDPLPKVEKDAYASKDKMEVEKGKKCLTKEPHSENPRPIRPK